MSEDVATRLRELARDHSEERLNLESYRRLRAPLLDSLSSRGTGGDGPEVVTQPRAAALAPKKSPERPPPALGARPAAQTVSPLAAAAARPAAAAASQPATSVQPGRPAKGLLTAGLVLLGAVLAIGAWFLWGRPHGATSGAAVSAQAGATSGESDPLRTELAPVLDNDDWSPARLTRANTALVEAGPERMRALEGTDWFQRFTDAVRQRVKEQQALGAPLTPDKSPLAALAATIGVEVATVAESQRPQSPPSASASPAAPKPATQGAAPAGTPPSAPPPAANASAPAVGTAAATPASSPRAGPAPAAATTASPAAPNAAASSAAAAAPAGQLNGCNRRFCQDRLSSGEPGIRMAIVPQGTYAMGNASVPGEGPVHQVAIRQAFAISAEEVSQAEYRWYCVKAGKPCPAQPSWAGEDYPVVNVSWSDATEYAKWLSQMTGKHYRLPSEAEWEYAARAGQTGLFPQGDSLNPVDAYFSDKTKLAAPAPRSQNNDFNPNPWHVYHMIGNVREWVQDAWTPNFEGAPADGSARDKAGAAQRVVRGGSYADGRTKLRLTTREALNADTRDSVTGIRLLRELP